MRNYYQEYGPRFMLCNMCHDDIGYLRLQNDVGADLHAYFILVLFGTTNP